MNNQSSLKPVITIIDVEESRRTAMIDSFAEIADVQYAYSPGGGTTVFRADSSGQRLTKLAPSLLTLRHIGDGKLDADLNSILTVFYSGNGGTDERYRHYSPDVLRIWRSISGSGGILTKQEAQQLIQFAQEFQINKATTAPRFLEPPKTISVLSTLAVLCQIYLAIQVAEALNKNEANAERLLGILQPGERKDDARQFLRSLSANQDLAARLRQVRDPRWWREPFVKFHNAETARGFDAESFKKVIEGELIYLKASRESIETIQSWVDSFSSGNLEQNQRSVCEILYPILTKVLEAG